MKIGIIQCNVRDGDFAGNAAKIIAGSNAESLAWARLVIVPAEALCGPDTSCFAQQPDFAAICGQTLRHIAQRLNHGLALLCAIPLAGQKAVLIDNGDCIGLQSSFYFEGRQFSIINKIENSGLHWQMPKPDILLDMTARPFSPGSQAVFEKKLGNLAHSLDAWALSANLAGGYGRQIYNGQSVAINPAGLVIARGAAFKPDNLLVDILDAGIGQANPLADNELADLWHALVVGTHDFMNKSGFSKAVLGLSGGMDSALVACIAVEALGSANVTPVLMPSPYSSEGSVTDALELCANLGIKPVTIPIQTIMDAFGNSLEGPFAAMPGEANDTTFENLQARIRGTLLMACANRAHALVLNTGNKSEAAMGYSTLYGDSVGAVSVLGDVLKSDVYRLGRYYCQMREKQVIPENIFTKEPSAELKPDQKDSDSLPPYAALDPMLARLFEHSWTEGEAGLENLLAIRRKYFTFQFKRDQTPPALKVSATPLAACPLPLASLYNHDFS